MNSVCYLEGIWVHALNKERPSFGAALEIVNLETVILLCSNDKWKLRRLLLQI